MICFIFTNDYSTIAIVNPLGILLDGNEIPLDFTKTFIACFNKVLFQIKKPQYQLKWTMKWITKLGSKKLK